MVSGVLSAGFGAGDGGLSTIPDALNEVVSSISVTGNGDDDADDDDVGTAVSLADEDLRRRSDGFTFSF